MNSRRDKEAVRDEKGNRINLTRKHRKTSYFMEDTGGTNDYR